VKKTVDSEDFVGFYQNIGLILSGGGAQMRVLRKVKMRGSVERRIPGLSGDLHDKTIDGGLIPFKIRSA
jgi:hypothetical protein